MDNYEFYKPNAKRSGMDILSEILKYCSPDVSRNIVEGIKRQDPSLAYRLKRKILMFDSLAYADQRGIQKLLKLVSVKDLAVALRGTSQELLKNLALNMSRNVFKDLQEEISVSATVSQADIHEAQDRILKTASELIEAGEMYIDRPESETYN